MIAFTYGVGLVDSGAAVEVTLPELNCKNVLTVR